jgi:hypothetical protein
MLSYTRSATARSKRSSTSKTISRMSFRHCRPRSSVPTTSTPWAWAAAGSSMSSGASGAPSSRPRPKSMLRSRTTASHQRAEHRSAARHTPGRARPQ